MRGVNSAKGQDSSVGAVVTCLGVVHMEEEVQDRVQAEVGREDVEDGAEDMTVLNETARPRCSPMGLSSPPLLHRGLTVHGRNERPLSAKHVAKQSSLHSKRKWWACERGVFGQGARLLSWRSTSGNCSDEATWKKRFRTEYR